MGLTEQEAAILRLVAGGYSNKEVARHLGISMGTVKNHISDIGPSEFGLAGCHRRCSKRLSVEILQRFPTTQCTQPSAVQTHVFLYFSAVSPCVLT
jgi:FixJ family two-component response regulator